MATSKRTKEQIMVYKIMVYKIMHEKLKIYENWVLTQVLRKGKHFIWHP
jgi:hypothetical protein